MTLRQTLVAGLIAAGLCTSAVAADKPTTLKFCHEDVDVYPRVLKDIPGLNIAHLKAVEQKLVVKIETSPLPWKRCQEDMREGKVDGIFAASFKTERMEIGVYPMNGEKPDAARAMMSDGYSLYRLKGSATQWDGKKLTTTGTIGAQPGYSIVDQLKQLGVKVDEGSKTADGNLKKLLAGRVDGVALQTLEGDNSLSTTPEFAAKLEKLSQPLVDKPFFLMLSKQFVAKYGDFSKELWKTLADVRESPITRQKWAVSNSGQYPF
ncbi:MAG: transporter substrate-binding domain-containing protein [Pseudomonadota bacterium]